MHDDRNSNKNYAFFCDLANIFLRQEIFEMMKSTEFVVSEINNLEKFKYNPGFILVDKLDYSQNPMTIVIAGNRLSKKHGDYNNYSVSHRDLDKIAQSAYGSSSYQHSFEDDVITISMDHRDRPQICANAYSRELWEHLNWDRMANIWIDEYSDLFNQLKKIIPTEYHGKIKIIH